MALLPDGIGPSGDRPHPRGPRLRELAAQREERYREPAEIESDERAVYEAVRAGVPTYLRLLDSADREARGYSAHLLSCFPELGGRIAPVLAARLAVEPDAVVGALLCLAAGLVGEPGDATLVHEITLRRGDRSRIARWTVLMGLARLVEEPDAELLRDLCDCLFEAAEPVAGWPFHQGDPGAAAAAALDALPVSVAPLLAGLLAERMRTGGGDATPFFHALPLLLSAVFPNGPLPAGTSAAELTAGQRTAAEVVVESGLIEHPFIRRALVECRLPGDEQTLRSWLAG